MLTKDKLKQEREDAFYKWFEKWWMEQDFENYILEANKIGNTAIYYYPRMAGSRILRGFEHKDFLECCKKKLPEIDVKIIKQRTSYCPPKYEKILVFDWALDDK